MWLEQLFEFNLEQGASDRHRLLRSLFERDQEIMSRLPLLNSLLDINMPLLPLDSELTNEQREERFQELIATVRVRSKNIMSECTAFFNEW